MNLPMHAFMNRFTDAAKVLECEYYIEGLNLSYLVSFGGNGSVVHMYPYLN